jgi:hypothetical protein
MLVLASSALTRCGTPLRAVLQMCKILKYNRGIVAPLLTNDMNERDYTTVVVCALGTLLFRCYNTHCTDWSRFCAHITAMSQYSEYANMMCIDNIELTSVAAVAVHTGTSHYCCSNQ